MPDRLGKSLNKNQEYFKNNLEEESYDFLVKLVESGKYSWEDIEEIYYKYSKFIKIYLKNISMKNLYKKIGIGQKNKND